MTLIMWAGVGKGDINPNPFIIATSDTRMIYRPFNTETLEFANDLIGKRDDAYNKVIKLTDNALLTVGGVESVGKELRRYVLERAKCNYFLDDFTSILEDAYKHFKSHGSRTVNKYMGSEYVHFGVLGFLKNGNPGRLVLGKNGEILRNEVTPGRIQSDMFAPTKDILDNKEVLMDITRYSSMTDSVYDHVLGHLEYIHALVASQEVDIVSETCLIHILKKVDGRIQYEYMEWNLAEYTRELQRVLT